MIHSENKASLSALANLIYYMRPSQSGYKSRKKRKGIPTRKEEIKLSLFIDDIILYIGNPTELQNKLWELISEYNTVTVYKVNVKRSTIFL